MAAADAPGSPRANYATVNAAALLSGTGVPIFQSMRKKYKWH